MTNEIDVKFDKMSYAPGETLHGKIVLIIMKETHADRVDFSIVTNENQWALFSAKKPTEYDADKKSVAQVPGGVLQPGDRCCLVHDSAWGIKFNSDHSSILIGFPWQLFYWHWV